MEREQGERGSWESQKLDIYRAGWVGEELETDLLADESRNGWATLAAAAANRQHCWMRINLRAVGRILGWAVPVPGLPADPPHIRAV